MALTSLMHGWHVHVSSLPRHFSAWPVQRGGLTMGRRNRNAARSPRAKRNTRRASVRQDVPVVVGAPLKEDGPAATGSSLQRAVQSIRHGEAGPIRGPAGTPPADPLDGV